jgi:hypothetical protein
MRAIKKFNGCGNCLKRVGTSLICFEMDDELRTGVLS